MDIILILVPALILTFKTLNKTVIKDNEMLAREKYLF
jgi:hypothetical protein